ncbi:alpha/beta hydrolase [Haloglomus litoreum]|uniref:alpha/beta hydrolase n=1 Tax=Haloglomus litoreum TaxID=3034026 RepID=UPI0023E8898D|nr:alpha/beta hydrolase [Haloglomus sp. DT116]
MAGADLDALDPECARVVREFLAEGLPEWHTLSVASARRLEDELFSGGDGPELAATREFAIEGPAGDELPLRAYRPAAEGPDGDKPDAAISNRPTVVFSHGGGWTLGTLDSADDICRELAARTGALVLSVDYRLAPEHPFPAALDGAYRATEWADANADALGGGGPLVVAGTSAGGGLAAAVALRAAIEDGPDIAAQVLLYPMLDRDTTRASYAEHGDGPLLTTADVCWFWSQYLRSPVDAHNPFAAPLRADVDLLTEAPPAVVATAGVDPLRDEGRAYADRLAAVDVPVTRVHEPDLCHGFCSLTDDVPAADRAMDEICEGLAAHLA